MANRLSSGFPKRIECDSNNYLKTAVGRCAHRNVLFLLWQRDLKGHTHSAQSLALLPLPQSTQATTTGPQHGADSV